MSHQPQSSSHEEQDDTDVVVLFHRYLEGALDESELARLNVLLHDKEHAQALFVRYLTQEAFLAEMATSELTDTNANTNDSCSANPPLSATSPIAPLATDSSGLGGPAGQANLPLSSVPIGLVSFLGYMGRPTTLLVLAFVMTALVAALVVKKNNGLTATNSTPAVEIATQDPEKPSVTPRPAAVPLQSGSSSLRLDGGTATLMIANVGHVIVEGPAQFDLLSAMRARLEYGRIKVRVTEPSGHGFLVETPDGDVTDLGTEFALDVGEGKNSELVVFEGAVDLRTSTSKAVDPHFAERLYGGDGVEFNKDGMQNRIVSIVRSDTQTFIRSKALDSQAVISGVSDNLRSHETKRFYEIVPGGLQEDALAYVDRLAHDWNGLTKKGMPQYLKGADYIKPFCDYKLRSDIELEVTLARPAKLFVFYDDRLTTPDWLKKEFRKTKDKIGLDCGAWKGAGHKRGMGPGVNVDYPFSVWVKKVETPGVVKLGPNIHPRSEEKPKKSGLIAGAAYGIAAIPLEPRAFSATP